MYFAKDPEFFQFQHGTIKSRWATNTNMPKIRMIAKGNERFFDLKVVDRQ